MTVWSDVVGRELHLTADDVHGLGAGESACLRVSSACREGADQVRLTGRWATSTGEIRQDKQVLVHVDIVLALLRHATPEEGSAS